jgi:Holliday junction DNA helicase RuvB
MTDLLTAANLLRPDDWDGYIGQEHLKMQMHIHIQSALKRQEPLGHIFLSGPPGCGKTTFGQIVANTLRVPYYHFESPLTTEDYRSMRSAYGVIHVDEVHNETKFGQEQLRTATEQGYMKPKGMGRIEWDAITFILSTTDPGKVIRPLVERCVHRPFFEEYSDDEMAAIGMGMADRLGIRLADQDYMILGKAAAGTPRRVSWFMTSARDLVEVTGQVPSARDVLEFMRYTEEGLTPQHIQYLTLLERQSPIGLDALREWCEMDTAGIRELERLLMKLGYIEKGNRGRELSTVGYRRIKELTKENA